jgi:hypothetical protein
MRSLVVPETKFLLATEMELLLAVGLIHDVMYSIVWKELNSRITHIRYNIFRTPAIHILYVYSSI